MMLLPVFLLAGGFYNIERAAEQFAEKYKPIKPPEFPKGDPPQAQDEKIKNGYLIYTEKGCLFCHGPQGVGGVENPNAQGGKIPPLKEVKQSFSLLELKEKIRAGVPESAKENPSGPVPPLYMPSWEGNLTEGEIDSVAAYLISLSTATAESWDE